MKKYFFLLSLIGLFGLTVVSCNEKKAETATVNMDAEGEMDSLSKGVALPDSLGNYVKGTFNGKTKEFKFIMYDITKATYTKNANATVAAVNFVRASESDAREKITVVFAGLDLEKATFPYTFDGKTAGQSARFVYEVKKSNVFIPYYVSHPQDATVTITSYKDGVVEGTFAGKVTNTGGRVIQVTEGSFKMKLETIAIQ
ncbi:MAG: hypothetical protein ACOVQA_04395 [Thermoflexibacteraceae bacterium]